MTCISELSKFAGYPNGTPPHPVPLPRKLALASLPLYSVRIRKRMRIGEGTTPQRLRPNSLSPSHPLTMRTPKWQARQGEPARERVGVRGDALAIVVAVSLDRPATCARPFYPRSRRGCSGRRFAGRAKGFPSCNALPQRVRCPSRVLRHHRSLSSLARRQAMANRCCLRPCAKSSWRRGGGAG